MICNCFVFWYFIIKRSTHRHWLSHRMICIIKRGLTDKTWRWVRTDRAPRVIKLVAPNPPLFVRGWGYKQTWITANPAPSPLIDIPSHQNTFHYPPLRPPLQGFTAPSITSSFILTGISLLNIYLVTIYLPVVIGYLVGMSCIFNSAHKCLLLRWKEIVLPIFINDW